ncbi:hypothetical protein [Runella sp.]|uniref:hypothetical protein n=1 Tax=Runella sp. TaxID=1960881 RepID=UPI003D1166A0
MNPKMLFTFNAVVCFLFSVPLMLVPQMIMEIYLVDKTNVDPAAFVLSRGYGSLMFGLAIALWTAKDAGPSVARRSILYMIAVANALLTVVHIYSYSIGAENSMALTIVALGVVLGGWAGMLLAKESGLKLA